MTTATIAALTEDEIRNLEDDGWPEPQPIQSELRPVPPLVPELIPAPIRPWLNDISTRMQCPLDFVAATALSVLGTACGSGVGIHPKRKDNWLCIPNLWGGVVAPPSVMLKSPSMNEVMRVLDRLEQRSREDYQRVVREHEADVAMFEASRNALKDQMKKAVKTGNKAPLEAEVARDEYTRLVEPKRPAQRRYRSNDSTTEKMVELLSDNPRGLLLFCDELTRLLAGWDREGRETDRAFYLESWNGVGNFTVDRIGRGTIHTDNLCVSVFGGIQPSRLTNYLYQAVRGGGNDGLVQRFQILVYPDEPATIKLVDEAPDTAAKNRAFAIIEHLAEMDFPQYGTTLPDCGGTPAFRFCDEAQELFYRWYEDLLHRVQKEDEPVIAEHLGKYRSLMPSLALIFHLVDVADGSAVGPVSLKAARMAAAWTDYLESHARRIYGMVASVHIQAAARLAKKIKAGELTSPFSVRDVYRRGWGLLDDKDIVERACDELLRAGWLREPLIDVGPVGRPRTSQYEINPKVMR
jgi:hypothetical protein